MSEEIIVNVSDFAEKHSPQPGDLFVVRPPAGMRPSELESMASMLGSALGGYGAGAIVLAPGLTMERYSQELLEWMADAELKVVATCKGDRRSYRVIDGSLGAVGWGSTLLEALGRARVALSE